MSRFYTSSAEGRRCVCDMENRQTKGERRKGVQTRAKRNASSVDSLDETTCSGPGGEYVVLLSGMNYHKVLRSGTCKKCSVLPCMHFLVLCNDVSDSLCVMF